MERIPPEDEAKIAHLSLLMRQEKYRAAHQAELRPYERDPEMDSRVKQEIDAIAGW